MLERQVRRIARHETSRCSHSLPLCSLLIGLSSVIVHTTDDIGKRATEAFSSIPPPIPPRPKKNALNVLAAEKPQPCTALWTYLPDPSLTLGLSLLACVSGWVDSVSFIGFFGLFTAHITGNFAVIGASIAHENPTGGSNLVRLLSIPVFLTGGALAASFIRVFETRAMVPHIGGRKGTAVHSDDGPRPVTAAVSLLVFEAAMLGVSMGLALSASPITDMSSGHVLALFAGLFAVFGMGIHGACGRLLFPHLGPLTKSAHNRHIPSTPHAPSHRTASHPMYATDDRCLSASPMSQCDDNHFGSIVYRLR